jgi:hypothetical protein
MKPEKYKRIRNALRGGVGFKRNTRLKHDSQRPAVPLLRINDRSEFIANDRHANRDADISALELELFASIIE